MLLGVIHDPFFCDEIWYIFSFLLSRQRFEEEENSEISLKRVEIEEEWEDIIFFPAFFRTSPIRCVMRLFCVLLYIIHLSSYVMIWWYKMVVAVTIVSVLLVCLFWCVLSVFLLLESWFFVGNCLFLCVFYTVCDLQPDLKPFWCLSRHFSEEFFCVFYFCEIFMSTFMFFLTFLCRHLCFFDIFVSTFMFFCDIFVSTFMCFYDIYVFYSIGYCYWLITSLLKHDTGDEKLQNVVTAIREGTNAFLRVQYRMIGMISVIVGIALFVVWYKFIKMYI